MLLVTLIACEGTSSVSSAERLEWFTEELECQGSDTHVYWTVPDPLPVVVSYRMVAVTGIGWGTPPGSADGDTVPFVCNTTGDLVTVTYAMRAE